MSGIVYPATPAKFPYKCASCDEGIVVGEMNYWFKDKPKGKQNYHKKCWDEMVASDPDQDMPDKTSQAELDSQEQPKSMLDNKVFTETLQMVDMKTDLVVALEDRIKKRVEKNPLVRDYSPTETGYLKHDAQRLLVDPASINAITQKMIAKINESAKSTETEGCVYSFESVRGANSFHNPPAAKDENRLTSSENVKLQRVSYFANPLFFLIHLGKRPILKCTIHGTICNESNWTCSKCADEEEERNHRRSLWGDF